MVRRPGYLIGSAGFGILSFGLGAACVNEWMRYNAKVSAFVRDSYSVAEFQEYYGLDSLMVLNQRMNEVISEIPSPAIIPAAAAGLFLFVGGYFLFEGTRKGRGEG